MGDSPLTGNTFERADLQVSIRDAVEAVLPNQARSQLSSRHALNPLVCAAHPLLEVAVCLQRTNVSLPLELLRDHLKGRVELFAGEAGRAGISAETAMVASYCLCTFIDEIIAAKPWGRGVWAGQSLLVTFHGEASGGERFFNIVHRLSQEPSANIDTLELLAVILALGMQGRYRLIDSGGMELEHVRGQLRRLIMSQRGSSARALSLRWQVATVMRKKWCVDMISAMLIGSIVVLATLFSYLDIRLWLRGDPVVKELAQIRVVTQIDATPMVSLAVGIAGLLAPEIKAQLITVDAKEGRTVITLNSDSAFASGSSQILPQYVPMIRRIGDALSAVPGRVVVIGYTDNQPPVPGSPSNWQLSFERASRVVAMLRREEGRAERFFAQGRGDLDPVVPNDSVANRARNRRVVITVLGPGAAP